MANPYLVVTLITGVLLVLVASYVGKNSAWKRWVAARSAVAAQRSDTSRTGQTSSRSEPSPLWIVGGVAGTILLAVGVSVGITGSVSGVGVFVGFMAGMLGVFMAWGMYHIARSRGMQYAQSVGVGIWFLGMLLLLGIVVKLVMG